MSKIGAAFLTGALLVATPLVSAALAAEEAPHRIAHEAAWGCRDKNDLIDLLFLGLSTSFDDRLAAALAEGRCVYFAPGESVTILKDGGHGLVKVQRGGAVPVAYWTPLRNVN
ncbi:MAG TPA: hypothetical protein VN900_05720 [Stellaceae bacterium]|nr:hypothetical protein [Stellaceae bacterium]